MPNFQTVVLDCSHSLRFNLLRPEFHEEGFDSQIVALEAETADESRTGGRQHAVATVLLAAEEVADMHLHHGTFRRPHRISQHHRSVGVGSCVEDNPMQIPCRSDGLCHLAFPVRTEVRNLRLRVAFAHFRQMLLEGDTTVDVHLASAQATEVHTINNQQANMFRIIHGESQIRPHRACAC